MAGRHRVVLVTGATGLLGPYLVHAFGRVGTVVGSARTSGDHPADLCRPGDARRLVEAVGPDVVVHAAGLTDVDRCEQEPELARRVNADAVGHLVAALGRGTRLVVISTDQVYPDEAGYHVEDATGPVNEYGRSKLAGEALARSHPGTLVARTTFFGPSSTPGRRSLSDFVATSLAAGEPVLLFDDVLFTPLHMRTLAAVLVRCVDEELEGTFNVGSRVGCTKAAFGLAVAGHLGLPTASARLGPSSSVPGRAPRPHDMRMDVRRLEAALGVDMPTTDDEVSKL